MSLMFFTQFPELQEADISCPVIAGDATPGCALARREVSTGDSPLVWLCGAERR